MTIYSQIIIFFWVIFLTYWLISAFGVKKSAPGTSRRRGALTRIVFVIVFFLLIQIPAVDELLSSYHPASMPAAVEWLGVILCGGGIALAIWARWHLGRNWGMPMTNKQDSELVTTGPYSVVRHPIYTGVLTAALGSALATGLFWLIVFAYFVVYFVYSAKREEVIMIERFGEAYRQYQARSAMLIPGIF